jgi:hypothetical protein
MFTSSAFKKSVFYGFHICLIALVASVYLFGRATHRAEVLGIVSTDSDSLHPVSQFVSNSNLPVSSSSMNNTAQTPIIDRLNEEKDRGLLFSDNRSSALTLPNTGLLGGNKLAVIGLGLVFLADSFVVLRFRRDNETEIDSRNTNNYQLFNLQQS